MKEFIYGSDAQFKALDEVLSEGKYYVFRNRRLPQSCTPNTACLWFKKEGDAYKVGIDEGIVTSDSNPELKRLLSRGELIFTSLSSMKDYFYSLKTLYDEHETFNQAVLNNETDISSSNSEIDERIDISQDNVIDKSRLHEIRDEKTKNHIIWPEDIAVPLKKKVFGQDLVIDALAEKVIINQHKTEHRLLVITLLGPTATGKSETAKSLADILSGVYDTKYGYIEIAGSEFIGEHTVHRFFGAPPGYVGHGEPTLLDPVRKNPYHVIVINEIEKADDKILVGLMEAIDTGMLGMADNTKPIDLNKCIMIFTSNIPIDMDKYKDASNFTRSEMCRDAFTKICGRPEISGKIGNFLVFSPLDDDALTDIILKFIREELASYNLTLGHVDEYLMADFLKNHTKYGARGIRGLVNESVGCQLIRKKRINDLKGAKISLTGTIENIMFEVCKEDEQ